MKLDCSGSNLTEDKKKFNGVINNTFSKECILTLTVKELKESLTEHLGNSYVKINVIVQAKHDYDEDDFSINLDIFTIFVDTNSPNSSENSIFDSKKTVRALLNSLGIYNNIDLSFIDSEYHENFNDDNVKISIQFTAYI